jgi:hypothetical protein
MRIAAVLILACLSWSAAAQQAAPKAAPATAPAPKVVFLLDASGSMSNDLAEAKAEIVRGVEQLPPGSLFNVVTTFDGGKSAAFQKVMTPAKPGVGAAVGKFLEDVPPLGKDGEFAGALATIGQLRPTSVWFCTDGNYSPADKAVAALTGSAKRGRYRLNVAFFGDNANTEIAARRNAVAAAVNSGGGISLTGKGDPFVPSAIAAKPAPAAPAKPKSDRPSIFQEY